MITVYLQWLLRCIKTKNKFFILMCWLSNCLKQIQQEIQCAFLTIHLGCNLSGETQMFDHSLLLEDA